MMIIPESEVSDYLSYKDLITKIAECMFLEDQAFEKHVFDLNPGEKERAHIMIMAAAIKERYFGVKQLSIFEGNTSDPRIQGNYTLYTRSNGKPLMVVDAQELTARRTACTSALAANYLARPMSTKLLLCGNGYLAPYMAEAISMVRPIQKIYWWSRDPSSIDVSRIDQERAEIIPVGDLESIVPKVDIISCATSAQDPFLKGEWLVEGQHIDLVGSYQRDRREADDLCISRAKLYCDKRSHALESAGDLFQAIQGGIIREEDIVGELYELMTGYSRGREKDSEITLFKSVGLAIEDLAAAIILYEKYSKKSEES
jgi:ornithine cyclodeaminase